MVAFLAVFASGLINQRFFASFGATSQLNVLDVVPTLVQFVMVVTENSEDQLVPRTSVLKIISPVSSG